MTDKTENTLPVPMLLYCPECGSQHVDAPDGKGWDNPPHRSHFCHECHTIWRPADVATEGVRAIGTVGKADTWQPSQVAALASHPPSRLTEHDLYYLRSILRHMREFQSLCNDAGFGPSVGGEAMFDNIDWLDGFIDNHAREPQP
jgi:hypothetical protein